MKIIPIANINAVNTIITKALLKVGEYNIIIKPYKLVKIKNIPSAYPSFLLNVDNSLLVVDLI
jgi:hypothetical protein